MLVGSVFESCNEGTKGTFVASMHGGHKTVVDDESVAICDLLKGKISLAKLVCVEVYVLFVSK